MLKLKDARVGDTVMVCQGGYRSDFLARKVTKVGRLFIYCGERYKASRDTGCGEYGVCIRTQEEQEWYVALDALRVALVQVTQAVNHASKDLPAACVKQQAGVLLGMARLLRGESG